MAEDHKGLVGLGCSNTWILGSNPTQAMNVYLCFSVSCMLVQISRQGDIAVQEIPLGAFKGVVISEVVSVNSSSSSSW
jgi:hypothetical protein